MSSSVTNLWAWLHTHEGKKLFRYTMVSAISTMVSFIVLVVWSTASSNFRVEVWATVIRQLRGHVPLLLAEPPVGLGQERPISLHERGRSLLDYGRLGHCRLHRRAPRWPTTLVPNTTSITPR